ncbi:MAG: hypothetical protein LAO23_23970 [Acidobacteriia bacterium]|nr:hypothetical protein [Terriglobia bacterium]
MQQFVDHSLDVNHGRVEKLDARGTGVTQFPVTVGVWAIFVLLFVKLK